jgi:hypothetical protein
LNRELAIKILFVAAVIAIGGVLAHMHVAAQIYHPVVQISSPDGLTFTALQDETTERRRCGELNDRFIQPVRAHCKECRVVYARCDRQLTGVEAALASGRPLPYHLVFSPGLRLAISGPEAPAKQTCDFIASDLLKRDYRPAICIYPMTAARNTQ